MAPKQPMELGSNLPVEEIQEEVPEELDEEGNPITAVFREQDEDTNASSK